MCVTWTELREIIWRLVQGCKFLGRLIQGFKFLGAMDVELLPETFANDPNMEMSETISRILEIIRKAKFTQAWGQCLMQIFDKIRCMKQFLAL